MTKIHDCEILLEKTEECLKSDPSFQYTAYYYKWKFNFKKLIGENDVGRD